MAFFEKTSKIKTDNARIEELLTRGVEDVFVKEELEKKLRSGKQLRVKLGIDPTGTTIHIGRATILWKLRAFQELGHKIVLIVGDFTAQIGDASDKLEKRPMLSAATVKENLKNYKKIIGKVIDVDRAEFVYNSSWLSKLGFAEVSELADIFTIQQMTERRNFKERMDKGEPVSFREFLYPLMQGYDSVAVKADIEIGGFDQLFNLKAGRVIQKYYGQPEQDIFTGQMLEGTDGRKMSTSWGNVINITDEPSDMFGKVMSLRDELIGKYFLLATRVPVPEITAIEEDMRQGGNPKNSKVKLAKEIVALYYGEEVAKKTEQNFEATFSQGKPQEFINVRLTGKEVAGALLVSKVIKSRTELRRLIGEGAITNVETGEKMGEGFLKTALPGKYRIGKHRFIEIK
ncbi:MAG: tyrosine--tRNA ligase [Candidatus Taylorbacteria bacterium CG11_big_fil_rev_8_21_14_0_20_46_11]|uniref:Tyrosine--tRNA ligase n=1 Tax=Candidatus Taylorbacteria bacterium CG11_big_fil_rev_8_21_14_0_20_46_11 TaxID=1975025 RepID=A0A2H0KBT7_9BACT|nr:MAG: tyrosine--tRNA ligase [Candidatus Taylorbacteria bacterium CG11_big_fil_rev_8_21_14_0_20_46_11]